MATPTAPVPGEEGASGADGTSSGRGTASPQRPPLQAAALQRALVVPGGLWRSVDVLSEVGSTNSELLDRARRGEPEGAVLATDHQTAGRGRLDRGFSTPPRTALTLSVLVRPEAVPGSLGWLPLLMGVAAVRALRDGPGVSAVLKWPNDVLTAGSEHKLAGILSEAAFAEPEPPGGQRGRGGGAGIGVVIGIGLNVLQRRDELPVDTATSVALCRPAGADRTELAAALLREFDALYAAWSKAGGDAREVGLAEEYRAYCGTLGRRVRVHLPGSTTLLGEAADVDGEGRLTVRDETGGEHVLSAGDVVHLRPDPE